MSDNGTCKTCRYWVEWSMEDRGECRRYAPKPNTCEDLAVWPLTHFEYWCGEHAARRQQ